MARLLQRVGGQFRVVEHGAGAITYEIVPAPEGRDAELQQLLGVVGRGEITAPDAIRDAMARLVPERFHG